MSECFFRKPRLRKPSSAAGQSRRRCSTSSGCTAARSRWQNFRPFIPIPLIPPSPARRPTRYVAEVTGVAPVTKRMGNLYDPGHMSNYAVSRAGLGEAGGANSGGYDGRYGTIVPWIGAQLWQMTVWDPAMDPAAQRQSPRPGGGDDPCLCPIHFAAGFRPGQADKVHAGPGGLHHLPGPVQSRTPMPAVSRSARITCCPIQISVSPPDPLLPGARRTWKSLYGIAPSPTGPAATARRSILKNLPAV